MPSFHILETAPYRHDEHKQGKHSLSSHFIQGMMKLSSLNYFHLFKKGDELLNVFSLACVHGKEKETWKTTEAFSLFFKSPNEKNWNFLRKIRFVPGATTLLVITITNVLGTISGVKINKLKSQTIEVSFDTNFYILKNLEHFVD